MNMRKLGIATLLGTILTGCMTTEQTSYTREEMDRMLWKLDYKCEDTGITLRSRIFVPGREGKYPMILFLHGAGQKGVDNVSQLYENDIGRLSYYSGQNEKCIIVVPQCPPGREWTDEDMLETLDRNMTFVASRIWISDTGRIGVTGFSMGGIGAYKMALRNPTRYRTVMPICGGPLASRPKERDDVPDELDGVALWAFNNINDPLVDNMYSKNFVGQLWKRENPKVRYTELAKGHHDEYVFECKEVMKWLCTNVVNSTSSDRKKTK